MATCELQRMPDLSFSPDKQDTIEKGKNIRRKHATCDMNEESHRLASFSTAKGFPGFPTKLAPGGFYYSGEGSKVVCQYCSRSYDVTRSSQTALDVHKLINPECPIVTDPERTDNIPMKSPLAKKGKLDNSSVPQKHRDYQGERAPITKRPARDVRAKSDVTNISTRDEPVPERAPIPGPGASPGGAAGGAAGGATNSPPPASTPPTISSNIGTSTTTLRGSESLFREEQRLATFPDTLSTPPGVLAAAGFYWARDADLVRCAFCRGSLRLRELEGNDIILHHRKYFRDCPFFLDPATCGNVPMVSATPTGGATGGGVSLGVGGGVPRNQARPDLPVHRFYADLQVRKDTFFRWRRDKHPTAEQLADCGFWFTGNGDGVKCFHCDGGLRNWDPEDDPWVEHARWFPHCSFLREVKGQGYIDQIQRKYRIESDNVRFEGDEYDYSDYSDDDYSDYSEGDLDDNLPLASDLPADDLMSLPAAQATLQMGYPSESVKMAIRATYERSNNRNIDINEVLNEIEKKTRRPPPGREPTDSDSGVGNAERASLEGERSSSEGQKSANMRLESRQRAVGESAQMSKSSGSDDSSSSTKKKNKKNKKKKGKNKPLPLDKPAEQFTKEDINQMAKSFSEMLNERLCKICLSEESRMCFLPCGHIATCANCAPALRKCPICRVTIRGLVRVYLA